MLSRIRKTFNPEEETVKRAAVFRQDARQDSKQMLKMCNLQFEIIVVEESSGQQNLTKYSSEMKYLSQTSKKWKL